ncbi:hypothetical protein AGMMS50268_05590 [Spirochaetia bacterium]|nr:hypothetical protein AGMMS50268_05590 [Spirochaetia bacterium]
MKKYLFLFCMAIVTGALCFAQNAALPRLAVVEFSTNITTEKTKADAITVRNLVESQMIATGKYQMITRDEIDKLLKNQQIAVSSISSSENVKKLQLQNINYIVTGSLDAMQNDYAVTVKVLDVATGQFSHSADDFMGSGSRDLYNGIGSLITKFNSGMNASGDKVVQSGQSGSGSRQSYKVGDRGPGGGFIFYAEGGMYMECSLNLGSFTWSEAKTVASNYKGGGFTDWHLPQKEELNMIYQNLKKKGLGGLFEEWYWSSSESSTSDAWKQNFSDGRQANGDKKYTNCVRAVRAF